MPTTDIHKSRKLKRFQKSLRRKFRAKLDFEQSQQRFRLLLTADACDGSGGEPSELAGTHGCDIQVPPAGWLNVKSNGLQVLRLRPEAAYALYQLLDRAFGKD